MQRWAPLLFRIRRASTLTAHKVIITRDLNTSLWMGELCKQDFKAFDVREVRSRICNIWASVYGSDKSSIPFVQLYTILREISLKSCFNAGRLKRIVNSTNISRRRASIIIVLPVSIITFVLLLALLFFSFIKIPSCNEQQQNHEVKNIKRLYEFVHKKIREMYKTFL